MDVDQIDHQLLSLKSEDKKTRIDALIALSISRHVSHRVLPDLLQYAETVSDSQEQGILIETLGRIGDAGAVSYLASVIEKHPLSKRAMRAAQSLGQIGDPTALPYLMTARHSPNHVVRSAARDAIHEIQTNQRTSTEES